MKTILNKNLSGIIKELKSNTKDSLTFRSICQEKLTKYTIDNPEDGIARQVESICNKIYQNYLYYTDSYANVVCIVDDDTETYLRVSIKRYINAAFSHELKKIGVS